MQFIHSYTNRIARRVVWLSFMPALSVCSGAGSTGTTIEPPKSVSDLTVDATTEASVTLSFTQVDDGLGQPANYEVRYSAPPMSWGSAASTANGTCSTPIAGTAIGGNLSCTVLGLSPATSYDFQLIAFRGTLNSDAVFGGRSNLVAASTASVPPPAPVIASVTVTPPSASIAVGATTALTATVKDQQGNVISGQSMSWSSSSAAATVSTNGVVTGVAGGSATVTATSSGVSGTASITVIAAPPPTPVVTTVTVAPPSASIAVGATVALTATVKDQQGNVMAGQTVTWSSNSSSATVSSSGVVTGIAAGSATITATSSGKTGTSAISVAAAPPPTPVVTTVTVAPTSASVAVGATVGLTATVRDQQGNVMTGQNVAWSSNSVVATVSSGGLVTGVSPGSATITAASSGKSGTSIITVTAPPPPPPPGGTLLFQENFEDANLGSRGWYDNTTALLSTSEHIAGSNSSSQYRFLVGATTPTVGGAQRHKFTASNSFYLSFYVKYSTNWVGSGKAYHPHEFYTLSTLDGDYDGPSQNYLDVYVEHNYLNGGSPRIEIQDNKSVNYGYGAVPNNLIAVTENRSVSGCNGVVETNIYSECFNFGSYWYNSKQLKGPITFQPNPGPGYKNDWNFVEAYFQLNTIVNGIGQANGVVQYWFNGTLIIDRHDILFRTGARPTLQFNQFIIAPYIGDGSPVDQSMWVDNLRVATARIP